MNIKEIPHFQDTVFFNIEQIAKYLNLHSKSYFEKLGVGLTHEEFRTLDVIIGNSECCQRDLAKLILRDRTQTGRLIDALEQKGLVERFNDTKGKRLVKRMKTTEKGFQYYKKCLEILKPNVEKISKRFSDEQMNQLKSLLKELKKALSELVDVQV